MGFTWAKCGDVWWMYNEYSDRVEIYVCDIWDGNIEFYKEHELGHYAWKNLTEEQRETYKKAYERDKKKGVKWFYRPYSMSSVNEDFADNYAIRSKKHNIRIKQRINLIKKWTK